MQTERPSDNRAVSYHRVSSPSQATDEELAALKIRRRRNPRNQNKQIDIESDPQSLKRQRTYTTETAERLGLDLVKEFTDVASGWKNTLTRKQWLAMKDYCAESGVRTIICFDFSRFGRPEKFDDLGWIMHWLQEGRFRLIGGGNDHVFGINNTADLVIFIEMWSSGAFSKKHSDNMSDAYKTLRKKRVHPTGQRAFGFRRDEGTFAGIVRSGFFERRDEADIVREVFRRVADGDSCKGIAADLSSRGVKTVEGGTWTHAHIKAMIRKPIYIGKHLFDGVLDDAVNVTALVPTSLWQLANDVLDRRGELYRAQRQPVRVVGEKTTGRGGRTSATALFDGLLVCAECGSNLCISQNHKHTLADGTVKRYIHYRCRKAYHKEPGCSQRPIAESVVRKYVVDHADRIFSPQIWSDRQRVAGKRADEIRRRLITVDSMVESFYAMMRDPGGFDPERLKAESSRWFEDQALLRRELAEIESAAADAGRLVIVTDYVEILRDPKKLKQNAQLAIDHLLVKDKQVVDRVLRHEGRIPERRLVPLGGMGVFELDGQAPSLAYDWSDTVGPEGDDGRCEPDPRFSPEVQKYMAEQQRLLDQQRQERDK